jgi:ATP-binding cassette subfamily B protein
MKALLNQRLSEIQTVIHTSKRLLLLLWMADKKLFIGMLFSFGIPAINPFINAYIYKLIIDLIFQSLSTGVEPELFLRLLGLRFITLIIQYTAFSIQGYMDVALWTKVPVYLYQLILSKLATLDVEYFENSKFKDILQRVRESYTFRPLSLYSSIFYTFQSILQLTIAFVALAFLNYTLSIAIILASIPAFFNQLYFSKNLWGVWSENSPFRKRFWYLSDLIQDRQGVKEMRIFQTSKRFLGEIAEMQNKFAKENLAVGRRRLRNSMAMNGFGSVVYLAVEGYVALLALERKISIGSLSYFTFVIFSFENGVSSFFNNLNQVFNHSLYVKDIVTVLDMPPKLKIAAKPIKIASNRPPKIEFINVGFSYPGDKKSVLRNFSLTINPGEKIALVGENGAGKTTIIKLLARFYDVTSGEILINGTNIKDLDLSHWYKMLGIIFQDFLKYEYTLGENIHFGKVYENASLDKIDKAAARAGADRIARESTHGYRQMLGLTFEGGKELSLGQWQKVALARAFLRDAPVLVLDEPTASIDAKSEKEIFDKVEKLEKNKTVITISHRFSTVRNADKIYVMQRGKVIESGNHDALLAKNGTYARLFRTQANRYK